MCEEERDGWQVTSICPATYEDTECPGHRHTGSKFSGVRFDRGIAEFHCFSDDHCDMTFGQVMKHLNQHYPLYLGKIWDWGEEDFSDFAEDADRRIRFLSEKVVCRASLTRFYFGGFEGRSFSSHA